MLVLIQARILAPQASLRQTNHLPRLAVAWDSEPVRRKTERSSALGRGGALGLFAALRRKVGVLSRKRYAPKDLYQRARLLIGNIKKKRRSNLQRLAVGVTA